MAATGLCMVALLALGDADQSVAESLRRARELLERGRPTEAIAIYRGLARAYPQEASFPLNAAIAEYKAGLYPQAIVDAQTALKLDTRLYPAWLFLGAGYLELDEPAKALEPLQTSVAALPADRNAHALLASALLGVRRFEEAAQEYEELTSTDLPKVWYGLGRSREGLAHQLLQRLQDQQPGTCQALAGAAEYERSRGRFGKALALFREALERDPSATWLHAPIAELYSLAGHSDWAAKEQAKAPADPPRPGGLLGQARDAATAAAAAYARLSGLPESPERHEHAADRQEQRGMFRAAASELNAALRLSPGNRHLQWRLGLALLNSNDPAAAAPVFQQLVSTQPQSAELNFLCGSALLNAEQADRARPYLEAAVRLDNTHAAAKSALGQAYLETGRAAEAAPLLAAALVGDDPQGTRHYQLARAYQAAGLRDKAAAALRAYAAWKAHAPQDPPDPPLTPP